MKTELSKPRCETSSLLLLILFYQGMNGRIEDLLGRLEHLAKQKDVLGQREFVGGDSNNFLGSGILCGRDGINTDVSVITIVGMGRVRKTTLAPLLYNDDNMGLCFKRL